MKSTFSIRKTKDSSIHRTKTKWQNLSSDNERLGLMSDEQYNENIGENIVIRRLFIEKERTMSSEREIDVRSVNLIQIDVFIGTNNQIRSSLYLSILFSFSNSRINGWFHRDVQTVSTHKLTWLCFNALLSNAVPSCVMLFQLKLSLVHCFCWSASLMTRGISLSVILLSW